MNAQVEELAISAFEARRVDRVKGSVSAVEGRVDGRADGSVDSTSRAEERVVKRVEER